APELLLDIGIADNKVDMWSLGVIIFQLVSHQLPIQARSIPELQKKLRERRIERPANITDDLIWDLLMKLLDFDPKTRISVLEAFQHPFFTSPQAIAEIPLESKNIAEKGMK
ncbi:MAG: hypothetical protein EZS28_023924, partial [Streblomastix strix]